MDKIEELENRIKTLEDNLQIALNEISILKNKNTFSPPIIGDPFVFPPPIGKPYNPFL